MVQNPNEQLKEQLKENFDFEQHHLRNQEEEKRNTQAEEGQSTPVVEDEGAKPKYAKATGFFDSISNSTQNKGDSNPQRGDIRKRDAETFGLASSS